MSLTNPPRNSAAVPFLPSTTPPEDKRPDDANQAGIATSPTLAFLSLTNLQQTPYSPPYTPPNLIASSFYEFNSRSFPFTPSTPVFSPIPEHHIEQNPFASPFAGNMGTESPYPHTDLDPYALPFVPTRTQFTLPPKHVHPHCTSRPTPSPLVLIPTSRRPRLTHRATSDRILTVSAADASHYSPQFPLGHALNREFVHKYAPGAQIGLGAFGFVVTVRDRLLGHEAAVKFIERSKVPRWGWSDDAELGHVPTEAVLLKLLDHPGIVKFLDFFQDQRYFYLVQELHGSPWQSKPPAHGVNLHQKGVSAPSTHDELLICTCPAGSGPMTPGFAHTLNPCERACDIHGFALPSVPPSASSSSNYSPPSSPVTPASPITPAPDLRPNMGRRLSHDLFECIEQHQRLSESQACYIFAQVVDVVDYLDSIGVTHRDIKDENVLIDRAFRVKLIDFGAASCVDPRAPGPRPWYRHFRGTVAYAPAEIIREVKCHQAEPADVWALGVLLSYLITGRSAFPTAADAARGRIVLHNCHVRAENEERPLMHQSNSVSAQCFHLLTRCLDPDPRTRASIGEVKAHPWLEDATDKV